MAAGPSRDLGDRPRRRIQRPYLFGLSPVTRRANEVLRTYEFTLHQTSAARTRTLGMSLVSDVAASVAAFEVLRDNPLVTSIQVTQAGHPVLQRTRDAGKSTVTFASGRGARPTTSV